MKFSSWSDFKLVLSSNFLSINTLINKLYFELGNHTGYRDKILKFKNCLLEAWSWKCNQWFPASREWKHCASSCMFFSSSNFLKYWFQDISADWWNNERFVSNLENNSLWSFTKWWFAWKSGVSYWIDRWRCARTFQTKQKNGEKNNCSKLGLILSGQKPFIRPLSTISQ